MRILVFGGRDFCDRDTVNRILDRADALRGIDVVVHGGANGADRLAAEWGRLHGKAVEEFPADWATHGKAAGPIRNQLMLDEGKPDGAIAFPGGRGTADMAKRVLDSGVPLWEPLKEKA